MSASEWSIIIAAVGMLLMQVLGRIQAWQLAVIALRAEAEAKVNAKVMDKSIAVVQSTVDGTTTRLGEQLSSLAKDNAVLREQLAGFHQRDATTAQLARGVPTAGVTAPVVASATPAESGSSPTAG